VTHEEMQEKLDDAAAFFRIEAKWLRRLYQDDFYNTAKAIRRDVEERLKRRTT
jgi:hypothetical protein